MKVLIVTDAWHPQVNGVVRTYEHLRDELLRLGHEVKVIGPADFPFTVPLPGYAEINLAIAPYRRLKNMIETYRPGHIHISVEGPLGWAARRYCTKHKQPFTTSYHTQFPDYVAKRLGQYLPFLHDIAHRLGRDYVRGFHANSKAMMVATQSLEDQLKDWDFKTPMHRLSRGVDLDAFYPGEKTLFKDLPGPVALYVGRIAIEKGLDDFLEMEWPGTKVLIGEGPSLPSLSKKYPAAIFTGRKTGRELAEHYRSADLFAFPSKTDTFGIVLIEALACGLPVAAFNVTGPKDIITEPFLGALHETDLATAARKALQSGTREQRVAHVKKHFTWENVGRQFEEAVLKWPCVYRT